MKNFPRLYKKTNTGAIQYWDIEAIDGEISDDEEFYLVGQIDITHGQLGTDSPQVTMDVIEKGKNIGKANETTPYEQAVVEAQAKWEKKKKSGYVESLEMAEKGELDDLIQGGIVPMLAHTFEKQGHKIKYPCYVQPKLDGIRCIAIVKDGKCTLWSRTRKPITSCPHIVEELERICLKQTITFDGELYNHNFKDNFEHIVHLVRQEEPDAECADVQYHIYDLVNSNNFESRKIELEYVFTHWKLSEVNTPLVRVETPVVFNEDAVIDYFNSFRGLGYEGAILRNSAGLYVNKRSSDLIKVKEFEDAEFEICGIEEGRGKLAGHVGAFVCRMANETTFRAKMSGETERLRDYFENHSLWEGKRLTVQYQGLTGKEGVPRFPVGLRIREEE
jgi:DNA ligase-1